MNQIAPLVSDWNTSFTITFPPTEDMLLPSGGNASDEPQIPDELHRKLRAVTEERDRLKREIEKLTHTADGVLVFPGMSVWDRMFKTPREYKVRWSDFYNAFVGRAEHDGEVDILQMDELFSTPTGPAVVTKPADDLAQLRHDAALAHEHLPKSADGKFLVECDKLYCPKCKEEVQDGFNAVYCWKCPNPDGGPGDPLPLFPTLCLSDPNAPPGPVAAPGPVSDDIAADWRG